MAASDMNSTCSACVSRSASSGSPGSQNGAASSGSSSAGKCAGTPRITGWPVSAIPRASAEYVYSSGR